MISFTAILLRPSNLHHSAPPTTTSLPATSPLADWQNGQPTNLHTRICWVHSLRHLLVARRERGRYDERLRQGGRDYDIELDVALPRPEATLAPARERRCKFNSLLFTMYWQIAPSPGILTAELDSIKIISTRRNEIETRTRIPGLVTWTSATERRQRGKRGLLGLRIPSGY
jgi:hypothetical protein